MMMIRDDEEYLDALASIDRERKEKIAEMVSH